MRKAHEYKRVDLDYRIHQLAYLNFMATGKKRAGKGKEKPVYPSFKKFYDYEKELKKVETKESEDKYRLINAYRRAKGN